MDYHSHDHVTWLCLSESPGLALKKQPAMLETSYGGDFPGSPGVKTLHFQCKGAGSIPGRGNKISNATQSGAKK